MKVAHLSTVHRRFDSRIFQKECKSLAAEYDVGLIIADGLGNAVVDGIPVIDLGKAKSRLSRFLTKPVAAIRVVRRAKVELVHFHDAELIPLGMALRLMGIKVIYDVHEDLPRDILIKEWIPGPVRKVVSALASLAERTAGVMFNGIVTATPTIAARFPPSKTVVVRNFPIVDGPQEPKSFASRAMQIAYVGTLSEARGVIEAVRAMSLLPDPYRLSLAGSFNTPELERSARETHGWQAVDYLGFVTRDEVERTLANSRVGLCNLLPTQTHLDSLPIKLFEYMAAGVPVVASDFPLWREILSGIDCAVFINPSRPDLIAGAVERLMQNPAKAERMGLAGQAAIRERLNWQPEAERLLASYRKIIRG